MFTILLALIQGKYKIEFDGSYLGTVIIDLILSIYIGEIILALIKK